MSDLITHLDELRKHIDLAGEGTKIYGLTIEPYGDYFALLHNAYPLLRERIKAGEKLAEDIEYMHKTHKDQCVCPLVALDAYRKATNT